MIASNSRIHYEDAKSFPKSPCHSKSCGPIKQSWCVSASCEHTSVLAMPSKMQATENLEVSV